ncbi:lysine exporter LysO family protein [Pseudothermotoga sp.]|uniref:lysine exporter LysO family protein n=1 Tax=Pseudothermotoga sp. TaxID=2033661 RepID=UPI0031F64AAA
MMALLLLSSVIVGVLTGKWSQFRLPDWSVSVVLYIIVFLVGLDLSREKIRREVLLKTIFSIVATLVGTYAGVMFLSFFLEIKRTELFAVASGFGWYSLSAVIITNVHSAQLGAIAFFSNVIRELYAIVLTPILSRYSKMAVISIAGATSMDTLLGPISHYTDAETSLVAFAHGFIVTMLVPLLVNLFLL